jgi:SAM-dependent methyltransferase
VKDDSKSRLDIVNPVLAAGVILLAFSVVLSLVALSNNIGGYWFSTDRVPLFVLFLAVLGTGLSYKIADQQSRSFLIALFLLAFALRLLFAWSLRELIPLWVPNHDYLSYGFLNDDGILYDSLAAEGLLFWEAGRNPLDAYWTGSQGWILVNTIIYRYVGHELFAVGAFNAFLGAIVPIFIYSVSRGFLTPSNARLAGLLVTLYPEQIIYAGSNLKDTSLTAAFTIGLWAIWHLGQSGRGKVIRYAPIVMAAAAYVTLTRFYMVPVLLLVGVLYGRPSSRASVPAGQIAWRLLFTVLIFLVSRYLLQEVLGQSLSFLSDPIEAVSAYYEGASGPVDSTSFYRLLRPPFHVILLPLGIIFTLLNPFVLWPIIAPTPILWVLFPTIVAWYLLLPFSLYGLVTSRKQGTELLLFIAVVSGFAILAFTGTGLLTTGRTKLPLQPFMLMYAAIGLKALARGEQKIKLVLLGYLWCLVGLLVVYLSVRDSSIVVGCSCAMLVALTILAYRHRQLQVGGRRVQTGLTSAHQPAITTSMQSYIQHQTKIGRQIVRQSGLPDIDYLAEYKRVVLTALADCARNATSDRPLRFGHLGSGHDGSRMLALFDEIDRERWHVTGLDLDEVALGRYGDDFEGNVSAVVANLEQMPVAKGAFHVVAAEVVLEHWNRPAPIFKEIAETLVPGGRFIFVTPNKWGLYALLTALVPFPLRTVIGARLFGRVPDDMFPTFYRANTVRDITRASAPHLEVEKLYMWDNFPFFFYPFHPLARLAAWYIKLTNRKPFLYGLRGEIIGVLVRPSMLGPNTAGKD